ncbi:MAG: ATP-dependent protease ATPase subunit HslU [Armatimonadetes bacterium]|nr:ATP-dependent protease ATPase subunit HslU [Armatimonadota bacterium]NOG92552.1 ATP-dependent protease ATPase subunit HslU [Armatimonadota bacterium]
MEDLTPREIVAELDRYIIGQNDAKRAVAVAIRNRYRRQQLPPGQREDIIPKNILMIGPTGVGKTEIARRLAQLVRAPFVKVEATKFTEVGYVGRDVESIVRDLVNVAVRLVETEKIEEVRPKALHLAIERLTDLIVKPAHEARARSHEQNFAAAVEHLLRARSDSPSSEPQQEDKEDEKAEAAYQRRREKVRQQIAEGLRDDETVEIEVEESNSPFLQVFSPQGMEEMGFDLSSKLNSAFGTRHTSRKVPIREAKELLTEEEAAKLIDRSALQREAIERAEQTGIVFIDELDKIAGREGGAGPDVSREGVQRDLLPIIEGSTVVTKFGSVRTDHILFIGAGAFHISKPSDLIPELQGRLPIRVELSDLGEADLRRILTEPKNALTTQYQLLLAADGVNLEFTDDAIDAIAAMAHEVNSKTENIGARRLHTIMERLLEDALFDAPNPKRTTVRIDADAVREKLSDLVRDVDLSKYIL